MICCGRKMVSIIYVDYPWQRNIYGLLLSVIFEFYEVLECEECGDEVMSDATLDDVIEMLENFVELLQKRVM